LQSKIALSHLKLYKQQALHFILMIITYVETYIYKPEAHINDGLWFMVLTPLSTIFQFHSVLLVEETRVPGEHHRPAVSH
jgi:hypothetical protein